MTTRATDALTWLSRQWEAVIDSATRRDDAATQAGIVGDARHRASGGYHISRQDNPAGNYSTIRADDRAGCGPSDAAAAVDMTYARTADLAATHERLRVVWRNRATNPAAKYINAWCGWDGQGSAGRYDMVSGKVSTATDDHKWHIHLEIRRRYVEDMDAMRAILAALVGTTKEDDMSWDTEIEIPPQHREALPDLTETMPAGDLLERAYANVRVLANTVDAAVVAEQGRAAEVLSALGELRAGLAALATSPVTTASDPARVAMPTAEEIATAIVAQLAQRAADVLAELKGEA
jgi:hypothetical protein